MKNEMMNEKKKMNEIKNQKQNIIRTRIIKKMEQVERKLRKKIKGIETNIQVKKVRHRESESQKGNNTRIIENNAKKKK